MSTDGELASRRTSTSGALDLLLASATWGCIPLLAVMVDADENPMVFVFGYALGEFVALVGYSAITNPQAWSLSTLRGCWPTGASLRQPIAAVADVVPRFNWLMLATMPRLLFTSFGFAASLAFLPNLVVAVIFESWPIIYVAALGVLWRGSGRYALTWRSAALMVGAFAGAAFVVVSSSDGEATGDPVTVAGVVVGLGLLALALVGQGNAAVLLAWADAANAARPAANDDAPCGTKRWFAFVAAFPAAVAVAVALLLGAAGQVAVVGAPKVAVLVALAAMMQLAGLVEVPGTLKAAGNPALMSVRYLTSVFGVLYLLVSDYADRLNGPLFVVGVAVVLGCGFGAALNGTRRVSLDITTSPG